MLLAASMTLPAHSQDNRQATPAGAAPAKGHIHNDMPVHEMMNVKGTVVDGRTRQPLAGILVQPLGDNRFSVISNERGEFTLGVPVFTTSLYVHAAGYAALQVPVATNGTVHISMLPDTYREMYGTATDIHATATMKENNTTAMTMENDLEDRMGADVRTLTHSGKPGVGAAMFIRGLNSLNADAQPLLIIDGVMHDRQSSFASLHMGDYDNPLLNINPEDVGRITILKNATAIYGAKGANGVILVDTKRGHSMATRIRANIGVGVEPVPRLPNMMNAYDYRRYASELLGTVEGSANVMGQLHFLNEASRAEGNRFYETYHNDTDWTKEVYRTAMTQNYNVTVQGGDNIGMYNLSMGYTDGKSTLKGNDLSRLSARFNSDLNILPNLKAKFDMSYTKVNRNVFDDGVAADLSQSTVTSPSLLGLIKAPFLSPYQYDSHGNLSRTLADADDFLQLLDDELSLANPTALLANGSAANKNYVENTWFNVRVMPTLKLSAHWSLSENFSYSLNRNSQRYYRPVGGVPSFVDEGVGRVSSMSMSLSGKTNRIYSDTQLEFKKAMGRHSLHALAGLRYNSHAFDNSIPQGQYAPPAGDDNNPGITTTMNYYDANGANEAWKSIAWYAGTDYNYMNRYFLTLALSVESSSRFGDDAGGLRMGGVSWGVFPGVHVGWVLTNERWFPKQSIVDYLQLNAGFDISGNDDIPNDAAHTSFGVVKYLYEATGAQLNNIGNNKIQWEQTAKYNVGLRSWMFGNRLGVSADFYHHYTDKLLAVKAMGSPLGGVSHNWSNEASLDNQGFEIGISGKPVVSRGLNVEVGGSIAHCTNQVKSLPNGEQIYVGGVENRVGYTSSIYGDNNVATIIGESAGVFYGYKTAGVFSTDAEAKAAGKGGYLYMVDATGARRYFKAGDIHFSDLNSDGKIGEEDRTVIGNPNPDFYGNLFATVTWGRLTVDLGFNYCVGNDIYNYQRSILESGSTFYNQTTAVNGRWRYEGQQAVLPRAVYGDPMGNARFSDRWIEDGSYLRLRRLNISYKVPVPSSWNWLQGLSVWGEATNLFTLTKYLGSDPEMALGNSVLCQGIDAGCAAQGRAFMCGLRINL